VVALDLLAKVRARAPSKQVQSNHKETDLDTLVYLDLFLCGCFGTACAGARVYVYAYVYVRVYIHMRAPSSEVSIDILYPHIVS